MMELKLYKRPVAAFTIAGDKVRVTPGVVSKFSEALAANTINVYCVASGEYAVSFYVDEADYEKAKTALHDVVQKQTSFASLGLEKGIGMITVTGPELIDAPGMLVGMLNPLVKEKINVLNVSTCFDSVVLFVDWNDAQKSYAAIEKQFVKGL